MIERQEVQASKASVNSNASVPSITEFYLGRLRKLVIQDRDPDLDNGQRRLVRKAIFSTLMDAKELGVEEEAMSVLTNQRQTVQPTRPLSL